MSFNTLIPLIKKTGSTLSPADFQKNVNVVFHDIEAKHYDAIHSEMWDSLQEQFNLLADDLLKDGRISRNDLALLDIGSGTGLSTELLLNTKLGAKVNTIALLDTSPKMLAIAEERIKKFDKKYTLYNAEVTAITEKFDIILICSVLHHIPDLSTFLGHISKLQNPGGIVIHLQDPNGDYKNDPAYHERLREYQNQLPAKKGNSDIYKNVKNYIRTTFGFRKTYIDQVNDVLLQKKIIKKRMTSEEIWSVTDIHVENLPFSTGTGISLEFLKQNLADYTLVKARSYGFFGKLKSDLTSDFQILEQEAIDKGEMNGRNIAATWIKK